jgi:hypothetical protein
LKKGAWTARSDVPAEALLPSTVMESSSKMVVDEDTIDASVPSIMTAVTTTESAASCVPTSTWIDPKWLVGKRVKIWWPGNLAFFDADVSGLSFCCSQLCIGSYIDVL